MSERYLQCIETGVHLYVSGVNGGWVPANDLCVVYFNSNELSITTLEYLYGEGYTLQDYIGSLPLQLGSIYEVRIVPT